MAELFSRDQDDEEQELQVLRDEDEDDSAGSNHTLTLVPAIITIKSEVFCLAFSDDGRWVWGVRKRMREPAGLAERCLISAHLPNTASA